MQRVAPTVQAVVEPVVTGLGYEYVGAEFGQAENGTTLRVYIDTPNGVEVDDCATVSRQLSAALDVDDVIATAYLLEVSSPGLDRPLFSESHFAQQVGETVKARTITAYDGRRNFKGVLVAVEGGTATVEIDGIGYTIPIDDIEQANLIAQF
jgi:ribosome maturation factor RimP